VAVIEGDPRCPTDQPGPTPISQAPNDQPCTTTDQPCSTDLLSGTNDMARVTDLAQFTRSGEFDVRLIPAGRAQHCGPISVICAYEMAQQSTYSGRSPCSRTAIRGSASYKGWLPSIEIRLARRWVSDVIAEYAAPRTATSGCRLCTHRPNPSRSGDHSGRRGRQGSPGRRRPERRHRHLSKKHRILGRPENVGNCLTGSQTLLFSTTTTNGADHLAWP